MGAGEEKGVKVGVCRSNLGSLARLNQKSDVGRQ